MWQDHRSRVNLRKMLVVGVWKWLCYFCACVCEKWASIICKLSLWKRSGAGGKDVSLSELDMKHRKQPLWSLLSCQSALHRDRMLPLLMWRTDRPETHMQTQINWEKRRRSYESDWCWHSNSSLRRHNHDDQLGGQSSGLLFYIRTPISLTACEAWTFTFSPVGNLAPTAGDCMFVERGKKQAESLWSKVENICSSGESKANEPCQVHLLDSQRYRL